MLKASRVAHQRSDLPRALVFLAIFSVSVCACDRLSIPTEPTVSVAPPASSLPPLPPAPPPAYTVSGVVTDGSSFWTQRRFEHGERHDSRRSAGRHIGADIHRWELYASQPSRRQRDARSIVARLSHHAARRGGRGRPKGRLLSAANGADATAVAGGHLGRNHWQRCRSVGRRVLIRSNRRGD